MIWKCLKFLGATMAIVLAMAALTNYLAGNTPTW